MKRRINLFSDGKYPVYEAFFADGTSCRLSFATCAKRYAKDGTIEFERGRRFMHAHKNPAFVFVAPATRQWRDDYKAIARNGGETFRRLLHRKINRHTPSWLWDSPPRGTMIPNPHPVVPIDKGRVWLSDIDYVEDPMTETVKPGRVTAAAIKKALRELLDALEEPDADIDAALAKARKLAA